MPHKPVRIVHQACHRLVVKSLAVSGFRDPVIQFLELLRILQIAILLFPCPSIPLTVSPEVISKM